MKIETMCRNDHKHFSKHEDVADDPKDLVKSKPEMIDLFYSRESNQNKLRRLICKANPTNRSFREDQLGLSLEVIKTIRPRIILVANRFASDELGKELKNQSVLGKVSECIIRGKTKKYSVNHAVCRFGGFRALVFFSCSLKYTGSKFLENLATHIADTTKSELDNLRKW